MVLLTDPTLHNTTLTVLQFIQSRGFLLLFILVFICNELHPDFFSNHRSLRIRPRLVLLRHTILMPVSSLSHYLGDHLPLNLVSTNCFNFLPIFIESVISNNLGIPFDFLRSWG